MKTRKPHAKLPGRWRVLQAKKAGGLHLTVPRELACDLGWKPGDAIEFVRNGEYVELHKWSPVGGVHKVVVSRP